MNTVNNRQKFPVDNLTFLRRYAKDAEFSPGKFFICPLVLTRDIHLIYEWVNRDYARYWGMQGQSLQEVYASYSRLCEDAAVYAGFYEDQLTFIAELYDPATDLLAHYYPYERGDLGMHILLAPAINPVPGFSWTVFSTLMEFLFSMPGVVRILVEPDARNEKIHRLNRRAGFSYHQHIYLPHKTASLASARAIDFFKPATQEQSPMNMPLLPFADLMDQQPYLASSHLQPVLWQRVNSLLVRKAISEFCHEALLHPQLNDDSDSGKNAGSDAWKNYCLQPRSHSEILYEFRARLLNLNHWWIELDSLVKKVSGQPQALDALSFIIEFQPELGISSDKLPIYLEEISNTLYGSAYKHTKLGISAAELLYADFQTLEAAMIEGHPAFVANNGRVGFDAKDFRSYSPESANHFKPVWVAAHQRNAHFSCSSTLDYQTLMKTELDDSVLIQFEQRLRQYELNPQDYIFMPVHPWQWFNKIASVFAADIARHEIVCLGYAGDLYQSQQSIRTTFNISAPERCYVKMSLSILNMGFMRGLSPNYMKGTPAINDWVSNLLAQDKFLQENGFCLLRELAAVGYTNAYYEAVPSRDTAYRKMLSCLWRESPIQHLRKNERLMTMAALVYVDAQGESFLKQLILSSGVTTETWIKHYLTAYLTPLIHCFFAHDLVFMPHGENLIMVLKNNLPVRAIIKDIGEEIAIMNDQPGLPELVRRVQIAVPESVKMLSIFIDVFDGYFRYLSQVLEEHLAFPEHKFWGLVADNIYHYQASHPQFAEKFSRYDFFCNSFSHSCLNRLQLVNNIQMIGDLMDQVNSLQYAGELENPLAAFKQASLAKHGESVEE